MNATGNETLDRIQQEIKESLRREDELREKYVNGKTTVIPIATVLNLPTNSSNEFIGRTNGFSSTPSSTPSPKSPSPVFMSGTTSPNKRFIPNLSATKGVMQKFFKTRGKRTTVPMKSNSETFSTSPLSTSSSSSSSSSTWNRFDEVGLEPPKVTLEPGKTIRNGFISAVEKMRRELHDFQLREAELRKERMKSQPDLMAALDAENESSLKPARSLASLYSNEDLSRDTFSSLSTSLKPARSLADLCDASDEELDVPGTHSLIMQFENLKQARA